MKYKYYIKVLLIFINIIFLYSFSESTSNSKSIKSLKINFIGENNLFISKENIDKLLIQNDKYIECIKKDIIDLKEIENKLLSNDMIEDAEVYLKIDGKLIINLTQRKPIARVISSPSYYIDSKAKKMPLSKEHSARVILIHGLKNDSSLSNVYKMIDTINKDEFLSLHVTDIIVDDELNFNFLVRGVNCEIQVGNLIDLNKKMRNFKAFYLNARQKKILKNYKTVNLQFNNQVVCTKKI